MLKITPGTIMVGTPFPNSGLAAVVAEKWSTLEAFLNPSAQHAHLYFWAHALWLLRQLHLPPWLLEYQCGLVWIRLDHKRSKGLSIKSYETPTTSLPLWLRKGCSPFPPWGLHGSRHGMTLRFIAWAQLHCWRPSWVTLGNLFHLSMSHFLHV